jgi:hypothetical protein
VDKAVRVKELKCALCGGPFTDAHVETVNGQWCADLMQPLVLRPTLPTRPSPLTPTPLPSPLSPLSPLFPSRSYLLHTVRWAAQLDDDAASPRSPGDDSMPSSEGGGAAAQFAHSNCAQNIAQ